jgi:hypothetical protein
MIKSRRMRRAAHVACMERRIMQCFGGNARKEDLDVRGRIILR